MALVSKRCKQILLNSGINKIFLSALLGKYEVVTPRKVSPALTVPDNIQIPTEELLTEPQVKSSQEIKLMRKACNTTKNLLEYASSFVKVGITTDEIDRSVHEYCVRHSVYPSPLGYGGFPKSVCTSVNNVVCHGIPDDRPLCDGDIINIDVSVFESGFHGDCSKTVLVGNVDQSGRDLVRAVESSLYAGMNVCRDGCPFNRIGDAVESEARRLGFNVIPSVAGHGVGRQFHEPPDVFHFADSPDCGIMKTGMIFTIEPAITDGDVEIEILDDGWTAVTVDGSRSAQVEHTILITENGYEILTSS